MPSKGMTALVLSEREVIEELLKKGYTLERIASVISRSYSCVKKEIRRNFGREKYNAKQANREAYLRHVHRIQKTEKNLTEEQAASIKDGIGQKLSQDQISIKSGVSVYKLKKYFRENNISYMPRYMGGLNDRISALESQIEILTQLMKEKNVKNS
jgi:IS30 family transposase